MRILVSNDDGVLAPGIQALVKALSDVGEITVVAPDRNYSGASNSLSLKSPVRIREMDNGFYSVEGTPTDCVHLALTGFLNPAMDIVVSGINEGANLGDDVLYSGTVAAAMEGRFLGFPAIAVSLAGDEARHYDTAAIIVKNMLQKLAVERLPSQTILNINVPDLPLKKIRGLSVTRLGARHCAEPMMKEYDPRGRPMYWIGPPGPESDAGPGTDFYAVKNGYVSITPLHLDLTHYKIFDELSHWLEKVAI